MTRFLTVIVLTFALLGSSVAFLTVSSAPAQADCSNC